MNHPNPTPEPGVPAPDTEPSPTGDGRGNEPTAGKCNARRRDGSGGLCRNVAGKGTDHLGYGPCVRHGGNTPSHVTAAQKAMAATAVATYGLPITIDPRDALLQEVYRTAGHVAFIADQIRALKTDDLIWGKTEEVDTRASEFPGTNTKRAAVPNVWLQLYDRERKHLVAVAKAAIDAGIEERRVRVAEQMGGQLAAVIRAFIARLGLTAEQLALVPGALAAAVAEIGGTTTPNTIEGEAA
jgi:hypothetical protein